MRHSRAQWEKDSAPDSLTMQHQFDWINQEFLRAPLLFLPVELIVLKQCSGGELVSWNLASNEMVEERGEGCVGGNDGGVLGTVRCSVEGIATELLRCVGESREWVKSRQKHICLQLPARKGQTCTVTFCIVTGGHKPNNSKNETS